MLFDNYIERFKDNMLIQNYSNRSIESYINQTKLFLSFIEEHFPRVRKITEITKDSICEYMNHLIRYKNKRGKGLDSKTIRLKIISIRSFFKFLVKQDFILSNPMIYTELPRKETSLPRNILTENEIMKLITGIKTNTPIGIRNRAIVEVFYSTGIRTSELTSLKISDVNLTEQIVIIVKGKGNKTRVVPLGQYACHYIGLYLDLARKHLLKGKINDDGYLFITERGCPFNKETINKYVIPAVIKDSGIDKKITCYTFRHSIATQLVKNKVDIRYVAELLGHESLETTKKYVHLDITDLKKMHALYHPRESGKHQQTNQPENI